MKDEVGERKERILVEISGDKLRAYITLSVKEEELSSPALLKEIVMKLYSAGVVYGIKKSTLFQGFCNHHKLLAAEGLVPVHGEDSVIQMLP